MIHAEHTDHEVQVLRPWIDLRAGRGPWFPAWLISLAWLGLVLAFGGFIVLRYRAELPTRCPDLSGYAVFCRAAAADELLGSLVRLGLLLFGGLIGTGVLALALYPQTRPCDRCGAYSRSPGGTCRKCGLDPFSKDRPLG